MKKVRIQIVVEDAHRSYGTQIRYDGEIEMEETQGTVNFHRQVLNEVADMMNQLGIRYPSNITITND